MGLEDSLKRYTVLLWEKLLRLQIQVHAVIRRGCRFAGALCSGSSGVESVFEFPLLPTHSANTFGHIGVSGLHHPVVMAGCLGNTFNFDLILFRVHLKDSS